MCIWWGTSRSIVREGESAREATTQLMGTSAQIATDLSPVSAVLLRARVTVCVQVAATLLRAPA